MDYILIRSRRKTLSMSMTEEGLVVRAPLHLGAREIDAYVSGHERWINNARARMEEEKRAIAAVAPLTQAELRGLLERGREVFAQRAAIYAPKVGVEYARISVRAQRTRWGSCSAKGNLNFNCLLLLAPPEVLDSVVVHELCHLKELNHSKRFYDEVLRVCPKYWEYTAWLKENGAALTARLPGRR